MAPLTTNSNSLKVRFGKVLRILKLPVALVCLIAVLGKIAACTQFIFNDGRLVPAFSMSQGYPPFYPLDQGPLLNTLYGPLSYVYYFPCALFSHNVSLAIMFGSLLSFAALAFPVALILFRERACLDAEQLFWLPTLCVLHILIYSSLTYSAFNIHADAPAILLTSLCVLSLGRREAFVTSGRALFVSATFGVLTAWTKQSFAAVLLLPLVIALTERRSWKLRLGLAGWIAFLNCLIFLIFSLWCGEGALLENLLRIPGAISYTQASFLYGSDPQFSGGMHGHLRSIVVAIHILIGKYLTPYLLCLLIYLLNAFSKDRTQTGGNLLIHLPRLSGLFFLVALMNLPLAAAAAINAAGPSINNDVPFAWFFILAIFCMLLETKRPDSTGDYWRADRAIGAIFVVIAFLSLVGAVREVPDNFRKISNAFNNDEATIAEICRDSPGKYYFPWNPLAAFVGEGKFYHWLFVIDLRAGVGKPPTIEHFNQFIPPKASMIGLPLSSANATELGFLGNYVQNLQPCSGPAVAGANRLAWFTFTPKP